MTPDSTPPSQSPIPAVAVAQKKSPLPDAWQVPSIFRDRLGETAGRQRIMTSQGHLLVILHEPPRADDAQRRGRFFWRNPKGEWLSSSHGPGVAALRKHLDEYAQVIDKLDRTEMKAQRADEYLDLLRAVTPLVRSSRHQHLVMQEAREAQREDRDLIACRDTANHLERMAELLLSDTRHGLDAVAARRSEEIEKRSYEMAASAHRLNMLAAFFFPLVTLTAVFGMNISHGMENFSQPPLFWGVLGVGLITGLLLRASISPISKKKKDEAPTRDPFT